MLEGWLKAEERELSDGEGVLKNWPARTGGFAVSGVAGWRGAGRGANARTILSKNSVNMSAAVVSHDEVWCLDCCWD